ncbi:MAG: hypothetical protein ACP5U2_14545, partial [Bryobacteraceae bacterium]
MLGWWYIIAELGVAARSRTVPVPNFLRGVTLERNPRWPAFLTSFLLHAVVLLLFPALSDWLAAMRPENWVRRYRVLPS